MRMYRYQFILHTEDGTNVDFVYYANGINKADAAQKSTCYSRFRLKAESG